MVMSKAILTEASHYRDIIELGLCMFIHDVVNDVQFSFSTGTDFAAFINLKEHGAEVKVMPRENLRVCYFIRVISENIKPRTLANAWREGFLKRCAITQEYYEKHSGDICSYDATERNKQYKKNLDSALKKWKEFCRPT